MCALNFEIFLNFPHFQRLLVLNRLAVYIYIGDDNLVLLYL